MRSRVPERPLEHVPQDQDRERQEQGYNELVAKYRRGVTRVTVVSGLRGVVRMVCTRVVLAFDRSLTQGWDSVATHTLAGKQRPRRLGRPERLLHARW
jgi:hypothetical protein